MHLFSWLPMFVLIFIVFIISGSSWKRRRNK